MKRIFIISSIVAGIVLIVTQVAISTRVRKDIKKKLAFQNTYAIQNVSSGMCVRPLDAGYKNGNEIIAYNHKDWECVTWEMIEIGDSAFLLKNLFTEKTFQPKSGPKPGVGLWQQTLGGTPLQHWEFIRQPDETYLVRLKSTELYLTISSKAENAPIVLMPLEKSDRQRWKLIRQTPWI
ncbi:RICIN domain-containing protein [Flavihumibacter solisilvae]|uniref:RICIN domain-containing protein n=1 Tax=Flavihumibacter solisilvae TaxID=1349421 RepID=UPI000A739F2B|nr:RICIN domain-containing protein [Flavihumibacter solisilvae]